MFIKIIGYNTFISVRQFIVSRINGIDFLKKLVQFDQKNNVYVMFLEMNYFVIIRQTLGIAYRWFFFFFRIKYTFGNIIKLNLSTIK